MPLAYQDFYGGRRVMITGGLGFIGSNIARRLVELGADVLLMDSIIPGAGANFFNGPHRISARAIITGGSDVATPSTPLIFNNQSGVIAVVTKNNGSDAASAINPGTGIQWIGGAVTLTVTAVSYVQGTRVSSVTCSFLARRRPSR